MLHSKPQVGWVLHSKPQVGWVLHSKPQVDSVFLEQKANSKEVFCIFPKKNGKHPVKNDLRVCDFSNLDNNNNN